MPSFTGEIIAFSFTANNNRESRGSKDKIRIQIRLLEFSSFEIETGENIYAMPISIELSSGEPTSQDGSPLNGCGALMYLPAYKSQEAGNSPSSVDGWSVLSEPTFDRIWSLLLYGCNLQHRALFQVKGTKFIMPNTHFWETKNNKDLLITEFSVISVSPDWFVNLV